MHKYVIEGNIVTQLPEEKKGKKRILQQRICQQSYADAQCDLVIGRLLPRKVGSMVYLLHVTASCTLDTVN